LRNWIRRDEANRGERADRLTSEQLEELRRLRKENTFYGWVARRRRPSPRDIEQVWLGEQVQRIHKESDGTYGSPKVHAQLRREGIRTSRERVERLMREAGLQGAFMRRRRRSSTRRDPRRHPSTDLVNRNFKTDAPDPLWGRRYLAHPDRGGPAVAGQRAG
jgi:transposase InsO family protein